MVSIRDVAKRAGVSHQTVSNALNAPDVVSETTRLRIMKAIEELGYKPNAAARRLRSGRSDVLAVGIATGANRAPSPIFDEFLHLLAARASKQGRQIMLYPRTDEESELQYVQSLMEQSDVDAIILNELEVDDHRPQWLLAHQQPFVLFGRPWQLNPEVAQRIPWVDIDGKTAISDMVVRLAQEGRSHIGFIGWNTGTGTAQDRYDGWVAGLRRAGLLAQDASDVDIASWAELTTESMTSGEAAAAALYKRHADLDAIVCCSDNLAVGALSSINHMVKHDILANSANLQRLTRPVLVTGFDDSPLAQAFSFPSIRQPLELVVEHLIAMTDQVIGTAMRGYYTQSQHLLPAEAIWRESPYLTAKDLTTRNLTAKETELPEQQ